MDTILANLSPQGGDALASGKDKARLLMIDCTKMALNPCCLRSMVVSSALGLALLPQALIPALAAPAVQIFDINITELQVRTAQDD